MEEDKMKEVGPYMIRVIFFNCHSKLRVLLNKESEDKSAKRDFKE